MISKILSVLVGIICIIAAALRQDEAAPEIAYSAAFLAAFGIINVVCSGFLGGYTSRLGGRSRLADSPSLFGDGIFVFIGWTLLTISSVIVLWLHWAARQH